MLRRSALTLSFGTLSALGALYTSPAELPLNSTYDYIVVGSGPGGSVVGKRLAELSSKRILVIEAGGNPDGDLLAEVPWLAPAQLNTIVDWNFTTTAQAALNGRTVSYDRGRVLGGSSSLNFMVWTRGSKDDYDRWASVTGDEGWSWDSLFPYMLKIENMTIPADGEITADQWIAAVHGTDGPLSVTQPGFDLPTDSMVINATHELGGEYSFNPDMNSGDTIGIGWSPSTVRHGARDSAWTSYLKPALASGSNLDVVINAQVTRVLQTGSEDGVPIFRGVEFAKDRSSPKFVLNATSEVILSAGSINTPNILLHSGIGDAAALSAVGIPSLVNNSAVGQNFQDHALLTNSYSVNDSAFSLDQIQQNATFTAGLIEQWQGSRMGELVLNACNQIGWFRNPEEFTTVDGIADPSAGPTSGHYELIFTDAFISFSGDATPATGKFFTIFSNVVSPAGRGTVSLASSDPFDAPLIDPGLLNSPYDVVTMREAVKAVAPFMNASSFEGYIVEPVGAYADAIADGSDAAIEDFVRARTTTVWHPTSSVSMTAENSTDGALNPDLTVKGTVGLRVVDASAFPFIPAAHTQAAVYILAERAADLIKDSADC